MYFFILINQPLINWLILLIITYSCVFVVFFPFIKNVGYKLRQNADIKATSKRNLDKEFLEHDGIIGYKSIKERHIAIIFISDSSKDYFNISYDEISPLIEYCKKNKINYKLYFCYLADDFIKIIKSKYVYGIHIFGHGRIDSLKFEDGFLHYRELKDTEPKEFVAQWHCNHGDGKSLGELIGKKYYVPYGMSIKGGSKKDIFKLINGQIEWTKNNSLR